MPPGPQDLASLEAAAAEHHGVRVWSIAAPTQQELAERVALVLGEHMNDEDELHITHSVTQVGSRLQKRRRLFREPVTWSELDFEYSALLVIRRNV